MKTSIRLSALALAGSWLAASASAQFPQLITDFQTNGAGAAYPTQPGSLDDLAVVMFQDPAEADVTFSNILDDAFATISGGDPPLPSTEESFVAAFTGFGGANGSPQFMDVRFEWAEPNNPLRWALIETFDSPQLGDPSIHLGGQVRMFINLPDCAQFEYPSLTLTPQIGVALLISETGGDVPLGFQDPDVMSGSFEFVGVSSVADANSPNPVPVPAPANFISITDPNCAGATTGPSGHWRQIEFDLTTANVIGWSFRGGDGVLDATAVGDPNVNRGVLAGIVLAVPQTDTTSQYVEFLIDKVEFEAPVIDPAPAPSIAGPVVEGATSVQVNDVVTSADEVVLEVDRSDPNDPFDPNQTFSMAPSLSTSGEARFVTIDVSPALAVGNRLRARQRVDTDTGPDSLIITVNPPAAFSATLSLDEDGNFGVAPVDFEWVGATTVIGTAGTQGKPIFPQNGVWQKLEYSLIPGVEPVIAFAGGNGALEPDGGLYNIDAMFFTIDPTDPSTGPYDIFVDHVFYIDPNDQEVLISDAETANPFPSVRGQSTSDPNTTVSVLSTLTSYDGMSSNRLGWEFPNTASDNTHAPYRPTANFPDSAKAVGMWLLVEDPRTSPLPLPALEQRVVGDAPAVRVSNIDPNATTVTLLVNGAPAGSVAPNGADTVNIAPSISLSLGQSISARYSTAGGMSDVAYPRVVQPPPAPTVQGPLVQGQTQVTIADILNTGNAIASMVSLYEGDTLLASDAPKSQGSLDADLDTDLDDLTILLQNYQGANVPSPGGDIDGDGDTDLDDLTILLQVFGEKAASELALPVTPALVAGQQLSARQTVNGVQSASSLPPLAVGLGEEIHVVINEFVYDDQGTDNREFVELYNAEPNAVDISGWTVRASDTVASPGDNNPDFVIPPATMLAPGDYYVIGDPNDVPNVDLPTPGFNLLENSNEALELLDQFGVVRDTVVYELNKGTVAVSPAEGGIWGNMISEDATNQSWARYLDGRDTDNNGYDFGMRPATPGANNLGSGSAVSAYVPPDVDAMVVGSDVPGLTGSFVNARVIDPNTAGGDNPSAIPPSPQGGNAIVAWDPSGGGNMVASDDVIQGASYDLYVYLDTAPHGGDPNALESTTYGLIGTTATFYNFPDPSGQFFAGDFSTANGNTGIGWLFEKTDGAGLISLKLIDFGDGGDSSPGVNTPQEWIVHEDIDLSGQPSGWHRLSIDYDPVTGNVTAMFDATPYNFSTDTDLLGGFYIGYREFLIPASSLRPPTFDLAP